MTSERPPIALEQRDAVPDGRRFSPSVARNKHVICEAYRELMPTCGRVLEIASGTGEHAANFLTSFAELNWIASELDEESRVSIDAWAVHEGVGERMTGPLIIDASASVVDWGVDGGLDGMFSANMIHIAPWEVGCGLLRGAGELLKPAGRLMIYGPFSRKGEHVSDSNRDFDRSLKSRDSRWGVRDLENDLLPVAQSAGLALVTVRPMPANNFSVIFEKSA